MNPRMRTRLIFLAAGAVVLAATTWSGFRVVDADRQERRAMARAENERRLSLALWRLDGAALALIGRIAARAPLPADGSVPARARDADALIAASFLAGPAGDVILRRSGSGDAGGESPLVRFEAGALDVAAARRTLAAERRAALAGLDAAAPPDADALRTFEDDETLRAVSNTVFAQNQTVTPGADPAAPAILAPVRLVLAGEPHLALAAPVGAGLQGHLLDEAELERRLLATVLDLLPGARLEAAASRTDPGLALAALPLRIAPGFADGTPGASPATVRTAVLLGLAVLGALAVAGFFLERGMAAADARARFATALAHELRTPLTTFRLYTEMLAAGEIADPARRASYLATLEAEARRMGAVVEALVVVFREDEGRVRRERHDVASLLRELAPDLERSAAAHDARLTIDDRSGAAGVEVDPRLVAAILANLVENACRHGAAAQHGVVLEARVERDRVELAVRDRGPGVPERLRDRLFAPLVGGGGSGLGLTLARAMARVLGGDLRLDGAARGGARFVLDLPRISETPTRSAP